MSCCGGWQRGRDLLLFSVAAPASVVCQTADSHHSCALGSNQHNAVLLLVPFTAQPRSTGWGREQHNMQGSADSCPTISSDNSSLISEEDETTAIALVVNVDPNQSEGAGAAQAGRKPAIIGIPPETI